jgi:hypothetical protein
MPRAAARVRSLATQIERAGMIIGLVMTGLELARDLRSAESDSGGDHRSSSNSSSRTPVKKPQNQATTKTRAARSGARTQTRSRATAKKE